MPTPITEFFNGGLVTAQAGMLLDPGELQQADDCVYRLYDPAIQRAPGRTAYNSTTLKTTPSGSTPAGIKGVAQLTFDDDTDQLLAWPAGDGTSSYLYKSDFTTTTGTFSLLTGAGTIASCVLNGTVNVTAPSGSFTYMIIGARVTGTNIPVGTYVTTVSSDTAIILSQAASGSGTVTLTFDAGTPYALGDTGVETLDVIQWQNTYFILPTGPVLRSFWKSFTESGGPRQFLVRSAGLLPITQMPTVTVQSGAGWSTLLGIGYYWFLITEILISDDPTIAEVEAGYTANGGRPVSANITTTANQFIRIAFPTITNNGANGTNRATHWGVYMSFIGPGVAAYDNNTNTPSAATFKRILTVDINETQKDIKFNNTTQGDKLPTTAAAVGSRPQFTNPNGAFLHDGSLATAFSGSGINPTAIEAYAGFGHSTGSPYNGYTVTGIEVFVVAKVNGTYGSKTAFNLWLDNNGSKISQRHYVLVDRTSLYYINLGSQFDTWGIAWTPTDIGSLRVIVEKAGSNSLQQLAIESIEVRVSYSGAALDTGSINLDGKPYQVVTYRSQIGTTVNDPSNYLIPAASTGDIFQGSLVLNDITSPALIRYSLPNFPESFPKPYFLKFDSKKKDTVTLVKKIGQILIVGMRDSIKRVNYLPTETDVDFQRGVAHEDITVDHGIVGPLAATLFDISASGVVLGYVGYNGFYFTDGVTVRPFNLDVKLGDLAKPTALGTSILRAYPREKWLVFYYCPAGATHTKNTRALVFSYDPSKIKEGGFLPGTGPISISARSTSEASLGGVPYLFSGHQTNGTVYVEDSGTTQPVGYQVHNSSDSLVSAPIIPIIRTRKFYPSGYTRDSREQRVYILYTATGTTTPVASCTTIAGNTAVSTISSGFTNISIGMLVTGTGILPGTIVTTKTDNNNITISSIAQAAGTVTLTFDDSAIAITVRGSGIGNATYDFDTYYLSTVLGDLLVTHNDNIEQGLELKISKITLPNASTADLGQAMKLLNWTFLAEDGGTEMNRNS